MITLNVEPYCNNCPSFEADVDIICSYSSYDDKQMYYTFIRCKNRNKCKTIYDHLKEEAK
jgi:hypothetical protein